MQAIRGISRSTAVRLAPVRPEAPADVADTEPSRALVPVAPVARSEFTRVTPHYPVANFLAHLIAIRQRSPQTRRRGRATPDEATAAYVATRATPAVHGEILKKSA